MGKSWLGNANCTVSTRSRSTSVPDDYEEALTAVIACIEMNVGIRTRVGSLTHDQPGPALIGRALERRNSVAIAIADIDVSRVRVRLNEMSVCMCSGLVA
jgi:hypothetical protein